MTRQRWPRRSPEFRSNWAVMSFSHTGRCRNDATYAALPESAWLPLAGRAFRAENPGWVTRLTPVLCDLRGRESAGVLAGLRPAGPVKAARKTMARDIIAEVRDLDARLKKITTEMSRVLAEHGPGSPSSTASGRWSPRDCSGAPATLAGSAAPRRFANYAGVAPVEVASAQKARHRLPRGGDRQLNLALHVTALTQVRMRASAGRAYYDRKIGEGKTHNEAMRCLKRRLADRVWRTMIADERRAGADPGGHSGGSVVQRGWLNPNTSSSDKSLPGPAATEPTTSDPAA